MTYHWTLNPYEKGPWIKFVADEPALKSVLPILDCCPLNYPYLEITGGLLLLAWRDLRIQSVFQCT